MKRLWLLLATLVVAAGAFAQKTDDVVKATASLMPTDVRAGEQAQVVITFKVSEGWHLYAASKPGDFVEVGASLADTKAFKESGKLIEPPLEIKVIPGFNIPGALVKGAASFALPVEVLPGAPAKGELKVKLDYQACTDANCLAPYTKTLSVPYNLTAGTARPDRLAVLSIVPEQPEGYIKPEQKATEPGDSGETTDATKKQINDAKKQGPLAFMLLAFLLGLGALATPCVWPMIPITVSFFSKKSEADKSNLPGALAYAFGIILTFTGIGIGVSLLFGATGVQLLAANPWINLGLTALFIALALNLFGVYEIYVPSSVVTNLNKKSGKAGGLVGPVLMGLAFSLTSFTCTVPFAGTVLASAATGDVFYPALGMFSFSLAFALPFFLLALFPQYLAKLPRSGTWLVSVKAYMGFLELAFALKFLSNIDLVFGWGLLTREAFLAVWGAMLTLASVYLLGWMKLPKDGDVTIGWPRRIFGFVNFAIVGYLIAAIQGAPMGSFSAFLPPSPYPGREGKASELNWNKTLEAATTQATAEEKLIFIDFTGVTCANCRVMEQEFFPVPEIRKELEKFSRAKLFTDRPTPEDTANAKLREELTKTSTNPVYVIMTPSKKVLRVYQGLAPNQAEFMAFLRGSEGS